MLNIRIFAVICIKGMGLIVVFINHHWGKVSDAFTSIDSAVGDYGTGPRRLLLGTRVCGTQSI